MKKVLKGTIFFIGLLILLSILSSIFIPKNNTKEDGMIDEAASGILSEKDNTIDVIFVGNSVIYTSIIPMKIWEDYFLSLNINEYLFSTINFKYK